MWKRLFLLFFIGCISFVKAFAQDNWKLSVDKEGIRIYTRPVPNSKINAVKVECNLEARPEQLVAVIMDIPRSGEWVYHGKDARVIKRVSASELYYYSEVVVPWPAQNRDYICHIMVKQDPKTKIITIDAPCLNAMIPERENIVRITHSIGKWVIYPAENNTIRVNYELEVDPAGAVPAWLVNMFATKGPLEIFQKLKLQVQKPAYKDVKQSYIEN